MQLPCLTILPPQEVKECAISCMGHVVSTFGDNLKAELPVCLPVLVDRMGNEITRLTAVKVGLKGLTFGSLVFFENAFFVLNSRNNNVVQYHK